MAIPLRERLAPVLPSLVVVAGVFLPWIQVDPAHEGPLIDVYYGGMGNGLELVHGIVLLPTVVVLSLAALAGRRSRRAELVVGVVGTVAVLRFIQLWDETFVSAAGAWVTLLGCVLLAGVAAADAVRERGLPTLARSP
ncbi:hypothetical protein [Haloferax sp. KTX1]|uniref:hypothetical protein n=1 Tax=Haloferax sp. KTX1 TaxID=2600597 RepID=UPI0011DCF561|nr:hypothetical protein [Haloferax sp. KTX1]